MTLPRTSPYLDFLNLEDTLTTKQRDLIATIRHLVNENFMPSIAEEFENARFNSNIPKILGAQNLIGSNLNYPGSPCHDEISYGLVMRELERCDSAVRSFVSVQGSLVMYPILTFGSEEQKSTWLPKLANGTAVGSFALTEAHGGSDPSSMVTIAEERDGQWLLNGAKRWVTNGGVADIILVWAKTKDGIRCFLCPTETKGLKISEMTKKLSLRASHTSEIELLNVALPKSAMLPQALGIGRALACLNQARYGIIWGVLGAAEACFEEALKYTSERRLFNKPLSGFQLTQSKLADMCLKISQGQLLALRLAQLKNNSKLLPGHISLGKMGNVAMALEIARTCRDLLGANGVLLDYVSMRHMCNLETVLTYEGTHEIHQLVVGQQLSGIGAFQ